MESKARNRLVNRKSGLEAETRRMVNSYFPCFSLASYPRSLLAARGPLRATQEPGLAETVTPVQMPTTPGGCRLAPALRMRPLMGSALGRLCGDLSRVSFLPVGGGEGAARWRPQVC